jgi:uncharacterized protein involved in exopolysaccharide biosynthesis
MVENNLDINNENNNSDFAGHQVDFFYLTGVLFRYKSFIFSFTTIAAILSIIYVLVVTPIYQSTVTLYPMNKDDNGPLKQLAVSLGISNKTSGFYIMDVLGSRRIGKEVIYSKYLLDENKDSVNLIQYWELDQYDISEFRIFEQSLRTLRAAVDIKEDKETSLVSITVNTKDPVLCKGIADRYCEAVINYLNNELKSSIIESIKFTEIRLNDVNEKLNRYQQDLVDFQNDNARTNSPTLSMEYKRKYQDVELIQGVVILLEKQLELLKIEEVKEKPIINILDVPDINDKPVEPQKRKVVVVNTIIAFFMSFVGVILKEKSAKYKVYDRLIDEFKIKRK